MNYSIITLTDVADCNVLLSKAEKEKAALDLKRHSDEFSTTRYATTSQEINEALQIVIAQLAASETIIATLPEGTAKKEEIEKKTRNEFKKFVLEIRKESYGSVALLEKEMELARVLLEISEVNAFMEAIRERKSELA